MNIKFKRTVAVDFEDCRAAENYDKTFNRGQTVRYVANVDKLSRTFSNIHFENGDVAFSVPNDAFEIC